MTSSSKTRTLQELRELARQRGLTGYSRLRKDELERLLADTRPATAKMPPEGDSVRPRTAAARKAAASGSAGRTTGKAKTSTPVRKKPAGPVTQGTAGITSWRDEQQVEVAKYAVTPPDAPPAPSGLPARDLGEDIEQLPAIREPLLCLLPQKPGVVHGYWALPPDEPVRTQALCLRLGRLHETGIQVLAETRLPGAHGHWYFQVDDGADSGELFLHLGYYDAGGEFVSALQRSLARIPSLYASAQRDRRWQVSDAQFRDMYLRAGGVLRAGRLSWDDSVSSPGGHPAGSSIRNA
jgi:hypothetical protein